MKPNNFPRDTRASHSSVDDSDVQIIESQKHAARVTPWMGWGFGFHEDLNLATNPDGTKRRVSFVGGEKTARLFADGGALDSQTTDSQFVRGLGSESGLTRTTITTGNDEGIDRSSFQLSQPHADDKKQASNVQADAFDGVVHRVTNAKLSSLVPPEVPGNDEKLPPHFPDSSNLEDTESYGVSDDTGRHLVEEFRGDTLDVDKANIQNLVETLRSELAEARVKIGRLQSDKIFLISELNRYRQFLAHEMGVSVKLGKVMHIHGQFGGAEVHADGSGDEHEWIADSEGVLNEGHAVFGLGHRKKRCRCV